MSGRRFAVAEGVNLNVAEHWTDAHLLRAQKRILDRQYQEALADLEAAATIPANLPLGLSGGGGRSIYRSADIAYLTGNAYEAMGDHRKAVESWTRAAASSPAGQGGRRGGGTMAGFATDTGTQSYYQALALKKLGQTEKAQGIFQSLIESGQWALQQTAGAEISRGGRSGRGLSDRASMANAHSLMGMGYLGLGDQARALSELREASQTSPDLIGPRIVSLVK